MKKFLSKLILFSILSNSLFTYDAGALEHSAHNSSSVANIGREVAPRIWNGTKVRPGEYPSFVTLISDYDRARGSYSFYCSGVAIRPDLVLTAGHCYDENTETIHVTDNIKHFSTWKPNDDIKLYPATMACRSDKYTDDLEYDYQIIRLSKPIANMKPAILNRNPIKIGSEATIVGMGLVRDDPREFPEVLQALNVTVIECDADSKHQTIMCSKSETGSTCPGDSGGPVYQISSKGKQKVISIHSGRTTSGCSKPGSKTFISAEISRNIEEIEDLIHECSQ